MDVLVSIIIVSYNGEAFLSKAIESALNQTYHKFELILVDNGSSDSTLKIMQAFAKNEGRIVVKFYKK